MKQNRCTLRNRKIKRLEIIGFLLCFVPVFQIVPNHLRAHSSHPLKKTEKIDLKPNEKRATFLGSSSIHLNDFVRIRGGCYNMGDSFNEGYTNERPLRKVCVKDFYLSQYEVTRDEWNRVLHNKRKTNEMGRHPITGVTRSGIKKFIHRSNKKSGRNFRLPTEAEWEYACRGGGRKIRFGNGKNIADPSEMNFDGSPGFKQPYSRVGRNLIVTLPVGSFAPNKLGLHDMSGNAWEWVQDNFPQQTNGIIRDGREDNDPHGVRCSHKLSAGKGFRHKRLGFRLAFSH